jgi:hypothetical protein
LGDELQASIEVLERELYADSFSSGAMSSLTEALRRNRRVADITRELEALRYQQAQKLKRWELAPIDGRRLSTGELERPECIDHESDDIRADPMLRYMSESGQDWR